MHEDQPNPPKQPIVSPTDMYQLGMRFVAAVAEQEAGGAVDRSLGELSGERADALERLECMNQELDKLVDDRKTTDEALADAVNRLTSADNLDSDDSRDLILTTNVRAGRARVRELAKDIASLEEKIDISKRYIETIEMRIASLENRPAVLNRILGHYARLKSELDNLPQIEPVPSLADVLNEQEVIIADADISKVTQVLEDEPQSIISVPVIIPPIPDRAPEVTEAKQSSEESRPFNFLPIPGGSGTGNRLFAFKRH
jgi:hypothetical protein